MPFVLVALLAFAFGLAFGKGPSRGTYAVIAVAAVGATWYFMR